MESWNTQLRKGVVELVVLGVIAKGETYGYELLQQLNGPDGLALTESTLYPLLARLTKDKLLSVRALPSSLGPPRRYYRLTALGRTRLTAMAQEWQSLQITVDGLLKEKGGQQ